MKYEKLSKNALYCMYVADLVTTLILLCILGAVNYFWLFPQDIEIGKWLSAVFALLLLAEAVISPYFRYHRYRYQINAEYLDIIEGYLFVKRSVVPLNRLHKLETKKGPIDRMFHVAKVVVTTGGGEVTIQLLDEAKATQIVEYLSRRINELALKQGEQHETAPL